MDTLLFCFDTNVSSYHHTLPLTLVPVLRDVVQCVIGGVEGELPPSGVQRNTQKNTSCELWLIQLLSPSKQAKVSTTSFVQHCEKKKRNEEVWHSDDEALLLWLSCFCATVCGFFVYCRKKVPRLMEKKVWCESCHGACKSMGTSTLLIARFHQDLFSIFFRALIKEDLIDITPASCWGNMFKWCSFMKLLMHCIIYAFHI